jgi:phosphatidylglycerol lysyltransferase
MTAGAARSRAADASRERALRLLQRHGWNATSFQLLEDDFAYFFDGDDAFVAYVDTGSAWVAGGAPVAPVTRLAAVADAFARAARTARRRASFFAAGDRFLDASGWAGLRVGSQPTWDPARWSESLAAAPSLRAQLRRAAAKDVRVTRVEPEALAPGTPLRAEVDALASTWLQGHGLAPMGFLVGVQLFAFGEQRLYFVARAGERVVGFLAGVPVYARGGWLFEDLLRAADAPNGTSELLIDAAMRAAASAGAELVTLGMAPLAGPVPPPLRVARRLSRPLYDFGGVRRFKAKLRPHAWEPVYVAVPPTASPWRAVLDGLRAFARGSVVRFGLRTVRHRARRSRVGR